MRKEYNQEEIERILKQDASIPETVEQRFRTAYENLGLTDITSAAGRSHSGSSTESMRQRRKKKALLVIAAAAVLTMGLGITALAVNHFLNVNLVEEDGTLAYDVSVNTEEKEALLVTAEPTYVPEGYVMTVSGDFYAKEGETLEVSVEKEQKDIIVKVQFKDADGNVVGGGDYWIPAGVNNYSVLEKYLPVGIGRCPP